MIFRTTASRSAILAGLAIMAAPTVAIAHDFVHGLLHIDHPWARATTPTAQAGAVYMELTNNGDVDDRLISVTGDIADRIELHTMTIDDAGVMRMRDLTDGIAVPAGQAVSLEPGGHHVMMIGLAQGLAEGDVFALTLTFEQAGETTVDVQVEPIGGPGNHEHGDLEHGDNGHEENSHNH